MSRLRFLCFNIHGGYSLNGKRDLHRVHDLMERLDVDIGVFQEMETRQNRGGRQEDIATLAGKSRPHHVLGPSIINAHGWYGNLIVSRYPIMRSHVHNLETSRYLEPRNAVDALIDTPAGKIRVLGTHLSLSPFERFSEAQNLVKLMRHVEENEKNPTFLMGDMNEWRTTSPLLRHLNGLMIPAPCAATFPNFLPVLKLDRVWYDCSDFRITTQVVTAHGARHLSDHLPVLVEAERGAS